jgi:hypothetical protein
MSEICAIVKVGACEGVASFGSRIFYREFFRLHFWWFFGKFIVLPVQGVFARIFHKITLPSFKVKSTKEAPDEEPRNLADSALRPNLNCWRHVGFGIPSSGPEVKILLNRA